MAQIDHICVWWQRDDDSSVGVVLLCWSGHHTQTAVKREVCKRVLASDLDYMMELFQVSGISASVHPALTVTAQSNAAHAHVSVELLDY